eukprot:2814589-Rhodomonas_salina.1
MDSGWHAARGCLYGNTCAWRGVQKWGAGPVFAAVGVFSFTVLHQRDDEEEAQGDAVAQRQRVRHVKQCTAHGRRRQDLRELHEDAMLAAAARVVCGHEHAHGGHEEG